MQASAYAVRGGVSLDVQKRRVFLSGSGDFRKRSLALNNLCATTGRSDCFGLSLHSVDLEFELDRARAGVFRSPAKARSAVRARASEGDIEDVSPAKIQGKTSGSVLPYVGVACLGVILYISYDYLFEKSQTLFQEVESQMHQAKPFDLIMASFKLFDKNSTSM